MLKLIQSIMQSKQVKDRKKHTYTDKYDLRKMTSHTKPIEIGDRMNLFPDGKTEIRGGEGNKILRTIIVENGIVKDMY